MSNIKTKGLPDISELLNKDPDSFHKSDEYKMFMNLLVSKFPYFKVYTPTITPSAFNTTTSDQTFTINGLSTNDHISLSPPALPSGVSIGYVLVSSTNTLTIRFTNATGGNVTPTSGVYRIKAMRD